ncbi:ankyrin repeat domain-containing protein [uncultured Cyclobacterium sp.]|uniref:ankyrin repeat domain-containing protein n=1 Tax=uncultured Cyclobacterium sp. TaxID=453820 RepID=UPI0030ED52C6|tara:strand:+ start:108622 stop:109206 length:585 start_codon:yes stop_codon:yes gene_type:complete
MKTIHLKTTKVLSTVVLIATLLSTVACQEAKESKSTSDRVEAPGIPIQEAAFFGNISAIKEHVSAKSNLNEKDDYGSTPLHIAATFGKTAAAELLIKSGADLNAKSSDGSTPLHTAAFYGRVEIVRALLEKNAAIAVRNSYDATALESVSAPFEAVRPIYDEISKNLGPLGLKLDYDQLKKDRKVIADLINNHQ